MPIYRCADCAFSSQHYDNLLKHFDIEHSLNPKLLVRCRIDGCLMSYNRVYSLGSHIFRKHTTLHEMHLISGSNCENVAEPLITEDSQINNEFEITTEDGVSTNTDQTNPVPIETLRAQLILSGNFSDMYSKLRKNLMLWIKL